MANSDGATLYFHGLPGSAAELAGFGSAIAGNARHFHVVSRADDLTRGSGDGYFARLATQVETSFPAGPLRLVGFSLGASALLRVAPLLDGRVERIDLIAPAAPLTLGDYLAGLAGAPVFRAALAGRAALALLTLAQAQAARIAPRKTVAAMMARACGADAGLVRDDIFIGAMAQSLRLSLIMDRAAYMHEIMLYVDDWRAELARVTQPVTIWQGREDNWAPPAMAQALAEHLPNCSGLEWREGLSHFSTLRAFLAEGAP